MLFDFVSLPGGNQWKPELVSDDTGNDTCTATGWEPMEASRPSKECRPRILVQLPGGNQWKQETDVIWLDLDELVQLPGGNQWKLERDGVRTVHRDLYRYQVRTYGNIAMHFAISMITCIARQAGTDGNRIATGMMLNSVTCIATRWEPMETRMNLCR